MHAWTLRATPPRARPPRQPQTSVPGARPPRGRAGAARARLNTLFGAPLLSAREHPEPAAAASRAAQNLHCPLPPTPMPPLARARSARAAHEATPARVADRAASEPSSTRLRNDLHSTSRQAHRLKGPRSRVPHAHCTLVVTALGLGCPRPGDPYYKHTHPCVTPPPCLRSRPALLHAMHVWLCAKPAGGAGRRGPGARRAPAPRARVRLVCERGAARARSVCRRDPGAWRAPASLAAGDAIGERWSFFYMHTSLRGTQEGRCQARGGKLPADCHTRAPGAGEAARSEERLSGARGAERGSDERARPAGPRRAPHPAAVHEMQ